MIKHIVLSGGGHIGFSMYTALTLLQERGYFDIENIKTIYATSTGGFIATVLCLKYNVNECNDYIKTKNVTNDFNINSDNLSGFLKNKGLMKNNFINTMIEPLLEEKELSTNITLKEFYEYSNIELNIYTVNITDKWILEKVNYKKYPDLPLITALKMTSAIPFIFEPIEYNGSIYCDGGIINNYPLENCINDTKCDKSEILSIKGIYGNDVKSDDLKDKITSDSSVTEYILSMMHFCISSTHVKYDTQVPNTLLMYTDGMSFDNMYKSLTNEEFRIQLMNDGYIYGALFLKYKELNKSDMS